MDYKRRINGTKLKSIEEKLENNQKNRVHAYIVNQSIIRTN